MALLHYATHPTLMAHENRLITPDYPGWPGARWRPHHGGHVSLPAGVRRRHRPGVGITEGHTGDTSYCHRAGKILGAEAAPGSF